MVPSVGKPPSMRCAGARAWVTPSVQVRQAYLGRMVTITRNCAGITSSRSVRSSPILCIRAVNAKVEAYASKHEAVSRLVTIPGIGALGATALVAAAGDGRQFKKARDLAAWLGLVPAEHSTGGKQTLLGISKRGNRYVRRLIIHGARSCFLHLNRANHALGGWLSALEARTHRNKAVVALANKLTRIVWAILTKPGTVYLQSKGAAAS